MKKNSKSTWTPATEEDVRSSSLSIWQRIVRRLALFSVVLLIGTFFNALAVGAGICVARLLTKWLNRAPLIWGIDIDDPFVIGIGVVTVLALWLGGMWLDCQWLLVRQRLSRLFGVEVTTRLRFNLHALIGKHGTKELSPSIAGSKTFRPRKELRTFMCVAASGMCLALATVVIRVLVENVPIATKVVVSVLSLTMCGVFILGFVTIVRMRLILSDEYIELTELRAKRVRTTEISSFCFQGPYIIIRLKTNAKPLKVAMEYHPIDEVVSWLASRFPIELSPTSQRC